MAPSTAGIVTILISISAATEITDILLARNSNSNDTREGVVLLQYDGAWRSVCYHGTQKTWGRREARLACRQLGFEGGWAFDVHKVDSASTYHLNNFDYVEPGVTNMEQCTYGIIDKCESSKLAGIRCYRTFNVQLTGGVLPSAGRVEVKYDDEWSNVCYQSNQFSSRTWSFNNVQVICRELGFPGALFAKQGGHGKGRRLSDIDGYKCRDDLRENSLQECFPNAPVKLSSSINVSSCGDGTVRENEAVAICAGPGYIGCFGTTVNSQVKFHNIDNKMTINMCRRHCKTMLNKFAFLQNGDNCSCGLAISNDRIGDDMCVKDCTGDSSQACGAFDALSVYDVTTGLCADPLNQTGIYFYGDIFNDFKCATGLELVGATAVQCVSGDALVAIWNNTFPECKDIAGESSHTGIAIGVSLGCILILLIVITVVLFCLRKRYKKGHPEKDNIEMDKQKQEEDDTSVIEMSGSENAENSNEDKYKSGKEAKGSFFANPKSKVFRFLKIYQTDKGEKQTLKQQQQSLLGASSDNEEVKIDLTPGDDLAKPTGTSRGVKDDDPSQQGPKTIKSWKSIFPFVGSKTDKIEQETTMDVDVENEGDDDPCNKHIPNAPVEVKSKMKSGNDSVKQAGTSKGVKQDVQSQQEPQKNTFWTRYSPFYGSKTERKEEMTTDADVENEGEDNPCKKQIPNAPVEVKSKMKSGNDSVKQAGTSKGVKQDVQSQQEPQKNTFWTRNSPFHGSKSERKEETTTDVDVEKEGEGNSCNKDKDTGAAVDNASVKGITNITPTKGSGRKASKERKEQYTVDNKNTVPPNNIL